MKLSLRLVFEALFLLGSQALFFTLAWAFLIKGLVRDYASNGSDQEFLLSTFPTNTYKRKQRWWQGGMLVQVVFALTLTWSCLLFELIILEILGLLGQEQVTESDIQLAEKKCIQTLEMIASKKKQVVIQEARLRAVEPNASKVGGFVRKIFSTVSGNPGEESLNGLRQELTALEGISRQLFLDIDDLYVEKSRLELAKTWQGKYSNLMGYIFSVYCIYKLAMALINTIFRSTGSTDPITALISKFISHTNMTIDVRFWSQQLSFFFVGLMIFLSIRGLLTELSNFFKAFSRHISSSNIILFLAHIMGLYFLSSILTMRQSLPLEYRTIISDSLGALEFDFYNRWSDVIFLISGIVSMAFLYVVHTASGSSNVLAKDPAFEQMIEHDHGIQDRYASRSHDSQTAVSSESRYNVSSGTQWRSRGS
ncbi:Golgi pH regulator B [Dissophora ornata]|nr:Golgi pH regulator B [Dissophora ornata]